MQDGYSRSLVRGALAPFWTERQKKRVSKSPFAPDWLNRFRRQRSEQLEKLRALPKASPIREIMEIDHMTSQMARENLSTTEARNLTNAVYMMRFLQSFGY